MRIFIVNLGNKVSRSKALYYILNLTWGLPMAILGFLITLVLLPFGRIKRFGYTYGIELHANTGWGFSVGTMFVYGYNSRASIGLKSHEFGHSVQNAIFGPFMPFLVYIPSATRFWFRNFQMKRGITPKTGYDDIWFEGSATNIGEVYYERSKQI